MDTELGPVGQEQNCSGSTGGGHAGIYSREGVTGRASEGICSCPSPSGACGDLQLVTHGWDRACVLCWLKGAGHRRLV